eukprot:scaffold148338_cov35-Tisochrysis_lutea.AAC.1
MEAAQHDFPSLTSYPRPIPIAVACNVLVSARVVRSEELEAFFLCNRLCFRAGKMALDGAL